VALPIFVVLDNLDRRLLDAAHDLGAGRLSTFLRVTLPMSLPGVVAGFVFVLIPTTGEFIAPLLVGGPSSQLFGNSIQAFFSDTPDWQYGSVLALTLVVIVLIYVWFGLNEVAAIAAVALNKLPTTVVMLREGARALDPGLAEMAQSFHMPRWRVLRHVTLPQLTPYVFAAARSGLALIWKIVLVAEFLGRPNGVGFEIGVAFQLFDIPLLLAYSLSFAAIVFLIETALVQPFEARLSRWRPRAA